MIASFRRRLAAGIFLSGWAVAAGAQSQPLRPHPSAPALSAETAALIHRQRSAIAEEAAFFGYDLSHPGWRATQAACAPMKDSVLLQYRREESNGAQFLFSAVVPRHAGRVQVVPVLYGNATPFTSAVGDARSIAVFNRAVPSSVVEQDLQSSGPWLQLALCYAEMAGADPDLPAQQDSSPELLTAPLPTLHISEENHTARVVFTDRNGAHRYAVWEIDFDGHGRLRSATATSLPEYVPQPFSGKAPRATGRSRGAEPKVIPLPPATSPQTTPLPQ